MLRPEADTPWRSPDPPAEVVAVQGVHRAGYPPTPSCTPTQGAYGWYGEQGLDVEAVHSVAPGADIAFVGAVDDSDQAFVAAINFIVTNHLASVVSNSWAGPEEGDAGGYTVYESAAIQAGLKGIGLYFASGDDGDYTQQVAQYGVTGFVPSPSFPMSLPEVTGVGGTSLEFNSSGGRQFETGWENGFSELIAAGVDAGTWPQANGGGGGGGCSDDGGTDDGGALVRPLASPDLLKDAGVDSGALSDDAGSSSGSGSSGAQIWWPSAPGGFGDGAGGGTSSIYVQPTWQGGGRSDLALPLRPVPRNPRGPVARRPRRRHARWSVHWLSGRRDRPGRAHVQRVGHRRHQPRNAALHGVDRPRPAARRSPLRCGQRAPLQGRQERRPPRHHPERLSPGGGAPDVRLPRHVRLHRPREQQHVRQGLRQRDRPRHRERLDVPRRAEAALIRDRARTRRSSK